MAFVSNFAPSWRPQLRSSSTRRACPITMKGKSGSKSSKRRNGSSSDVPSGSEKPPGRAGNAISPEEMLRKDLERIRAKEKEKGKQPTKVSPLGSVKSAIETILLWDFFLVLGLLAWLVVALIPHFAAKNDVLLDAWLGLWQPFIQPVLGVLMLGTIVQGTASFIAKK